MARITVEMISQKEFTLEPKGYNRDEVDNFLDAICEEFDQMEKEIHELRQKNASVRPAAAVSGQAPASGVSDEDENSFREILEMARKVKDETIQKAREDAAAIRAKAEAEATERLDGLNEKRDELTREVADLKETAARYRKDFEALLQAQQEALEKAEHLF